MQYASRRHGLDFAGANEHGTDAVLLEEAQRRASGQSGPQRQPHIAHDHISAHPAGYWRIQGYRQTDLLTRPPFAHGNLNEFLANGGFLGAAPIPAPPGLPESPDRESRSDRILRFYDIFA